MALFASYSYHAFITDREGDTLELEAEPTRRDRERRDLKYGVGNHLPSGRSANAASVQVLAHNLVDLPQVWGSRW